MRAYKNSGICSVGGCPFPAKARGWCNGHYRLLREQVPREGPAVPYGSHLNDGACSVAECARPAVARGLCNSHYGKWRATGEVGGDIRGWVKSDDLWSRVDVSSTGLCWLWKGSVTAGGYGSALVRIGGRKRAPHLAAWEITNGAIPPGLFIDHECHNAAVRAGTCAPGRCEHRLCCNPAHLVLRTRAEHNEASPNWGSRTVAHGLSRDDVAVIKARLAVGDRGVDIALDFSVSQSAISDIKHGRRYAGC